MQARISRRRLREWLATRERIDEEGIPILPAIPRSDGHGLKVWCRYCGTWHFHGHGGGHRAGHCPAHERLGYILEAVEVDPALRGA